MSKLKYYFSIALFLVVFSLKAQTGLTQKIDTLLKIYDTKDTPGLVIKITKGDTVLYSKGLGIANLDYSIKNSDSTVFSIASISKQFTAAAVWSLIRASKLSLDDNISSFFPEFPNYGKSIKIKHLLNHSSGIRNYHTTMFLSGFDYNRDYYDNAYVLELAKRQKQLNNQPGERITYSNTNYNLLALIVEQVSKQNLDEYLKVNILTPLGMHDTFVRVSKGQPIKNRAIGYQKQGDTYISSTSNQLSYGAGSMGSHLNDLMIWANMLNGNISGFTELALFLKTTELLTSGQKANYARSLMVDDYMGYTTYSHSGFGFGGQTQLITIPEQNISIVILTNLQSINPTPISYKIINLLGLNTKQDIKTISKVLPFKSQKLNAFVGDYKEINSDMTMRISLESDTLKAQGSMGERALPLMQTNTNTFVRRNDQNVKYDFTKTSKYDMIISFGGTPFYFKCANLITENPKNLNTFTGNYYSEELETTYHFFIDNNTLKLSYTNNDSITLYPVQLNQFGNRDRTLFHFKTEGTQQITGMLLSCDGQSSSISFTKDQTQD